MKTIKSKLLLAILMVTFLFGVIIFVATMVQMQGQKETLATLGQMQAKEITEETTNTLEELEKQIAEDFSSASTKYFNEIFQNVRKHVVTIAKKTEQLYKEGKTVSNIDDKWGLVSGVTFSQVENEFKIIAPVRDYIYYLPDYDTKHLENLDVYIMTESGMCLDGTGDALGTDYADLRNENWYQMAKNTNTLYWSGIFTGKVSKKVKVICSAPIVDANGRFRGCVAGDIAVSSFQNMLEDFNEEQITSVIFFDKDKELMYATNDFKNTELAQKYLKNGENFVTSDGQIFSFRTMEETDWTICLVLDEEKILETIQTVQDNIMRNTAETNEIIQKSMRKSILIFILIAAIGAVVTIVLTTFLSNNLVRPIHELMKQVTIVGTGNLEQQIQVSSKDEVGQLADSFNQMTSDLKKYMDNVNTMATERERLAAELDVAKQIQMNMLPTTFPAFPDRSEFDIYAVIHPVKEGGGNFYDFFMVDAHHIGVVIGDVAGKGVPATIFAVITKTHIKNYSQLGYSPDRVLMETNNQLSYKNDAGLTVSVFLAIVDLRDGQMEYVNAGQMAPLWKHSGEELKFLEAKSCFSLGSMENVPYWKQSIQLTQGDMLFLHTQGVSKTVDEKGNEFTQEYLNELLEQLIQYKYQLPDILDSLQAEQERFAGDAAQPDDSTMVLFRFFGK